MHIIVLEQEPSSRRGGQEVVLLDFCRGLAQRGHNITLLYTKEANLLEQYKQFCQQIVKVNRFIIYRPEHIFNFLADIWKVTKNIPTTENSIVLSNQFQDTPFGHALAKAKNIELVCYLHLPPPPNKLVRWQWNMNPKSLKQFISLSNIRNQWTMGLKGVKHFIAVSNQTKLDWVKSGYKEDIIDVVYNGIDTEVYKPADDFFQIRKQWDIPVDTKVISYVGRIDKEKGLETLIKAFALLVKSGSNTKLLIAGKPLLHGEDYKKSLEQLTINLGIENHVQFLGHVNNTTSLYQVSDVTVLPSEWSEPFPRSIIESISCGIPVVASRIGGIPESLSGEFDSLLFQPGNERDLADTLNSIMHWREQDPELGNRCRQHVLNKFSLQKMVDGIEKVLEHRFCGLGA